MLDDSILQEFIDQFLGYGSFEAPFWFVGMEEGGGNSVFEINKRVSVWKEMGGSTLVDLFEYHQKIGLTEFFGDKARLQKTWSKIIRVIFGIHKCDVDNNGIREYQNRFLGRKDRETCLIELLPLPSPNTSGWLYGEFSQIAYLKDRETYQNKVRSMRAGFIRQQIREFKPKVVLFYGSTYEDIWLSIADTKVNFTRNSEGVAFGDDGRTQFVITKHPASKGISNQYFDAVGRQISERIDRITV